MEEQNHHSPEEAKEKIRMVLKQRKAAAAGVILLLFVLAAGIYFYAFDRPDLHGKARVEIPRNATGRDIGDLLESKGVIRSGTMLRFYTRLFGTGNELQSGIYTIRQGLSIREALEELQSGKADTVTVTVPEGYTVRQIAGVLKEAGVEGADQFEETAASYGPLKYQYGPAAVPIKAEGFLFPDTYQIPRSYTARQICDVMYKRTDEVLSPQIRDEAKKKNISLHDLMTLASMVEKEARFREDQVPIASVMLRRLQEGMPLQIDATIQYILGSPKAELSISDTRIESPYNTYLHPGLPPGPIGAPGADAIMAVLNADPGEYLYYVAQADGHHVFTKTYEEHQAETENIYGSSE